MKVLILGKGFIGTRLEKHLADLEYEVDCISKEDVDYTDTRELEEYIYWQGLDVIINASGYTGSPNVDACEDDKNNTWKYNVKAPYDIYNVCEENAVKMIHISSGCIYDGYNKPFTEEDEPNFGLWSEYSSWYSTTKHAGEMMLEDTKAYIMRIRMPFCGDNTSRNILVKLLQYDNIISMNNSLTGVEDFCEFIDKFLSRIDTLTTGIYNVVNPDPVNGEDIIDILTGYGICNPDWNIITLDELYEKHTKANRSNCTLNTDKISKLDLQLPNTINSLERQVRKLSVELKPFQ
jgi:dTDP-4-dehydrorhamnose reductase